MVGILVGVSVLFKLALVVKDSNFDGKSDFNVVFSKEKTQTIIASFSPSSGSVAVLDIKTEINPFDIEKKFEIPIDGIIKIPNNQNLEDIEFDALFKSAIFGRFDTKLTCVDLLRLWFFSKTVSKSSTTIKNFSNASGVSDEEIDKLSSALFNDEEINQEKISVAIVNGTNVLGLGNRLARLINNIGGNVVSVSSSDSLADSEIVYTKSASSTYTLNRISEILKFRKSESEKAEIADIIIKIGKNSIDSIGF